MKFPGKAAASSALRKKETSSNPRGGLWSRALLLIGCGYLSLVILAGLAFFVIPALDHARSVEIAQEQAELQWRKDILDLKRRMGSYWKLKQKRRASILCLQGARDRGELPLSGNVVLDPNP